MLHEKATLKEGDDASADQFTKWLNAEAMRAKAWPTKFWRHRPQASRRRLGTRLSLGLLTRSR
jgi:hypothetical protein